MKLAFVTSLVPTSKPQTGFEIANQAILAALRGAGHQVTVFGFARPEDEVAPDPDLVLLRRLVIENHRAGALRKLGWVLGSLALGLPVASAKLSLGGAGAAVQAIGAHGPFDAVVLNSVTMPGAVPKLAGLAPTLLVAHNIEHVSARENARHAGSALARWLYAREARLLERIETELVERSAFIWCLAEEDRRALGPGAAPKSAVLPLLSGPSTVEDRDLTSGRSPDWDVGLIGTWTWEPNLAGLRWFFNQVVPKLPLGLRIAVAGRLPAGVPAPAGVTLLGRVPDAAAFLRDCAVVALTSRAGTGVQLKTIEAFQLGLPAVATPLSLRGFTHWPDNVVPADGEAAYAAALASHVAAVRAGRLGRVDGGQFMQTQREAMAGALTAGLARII